MSSTVQAREITVIATKGTQVNKITSSAATWGELKSELRDSYDLSKLIAVENVNRNTLELDAAILPTSPFRLFLRPAKTKSGADFASMGYKDLKDYIKNNPSVKDPLNVFAKESGRNWTQLKTEELQEQLAKISGGSKSGVRKVTAKSSKKAVKVITKTEAPKQEKAPAPSCEKNSGETDYVLALTNFEILLQNAPAQISTQVEKISKYCQEAIAILSGEETQEMRDAQEKADIEREMRELGL